MKTIGVLLIVVLLFLLFFGTMGLTTKQAIVITFLGIGLSYIAVSFVGIVIVAIIAGFYLFADQNNPIIKLAMAQLFLIAIWNFAFILVPSAKEISLAGIHLQTVGGYFIYGMSMLLH